MEQASPQHEQVQPPLERLGDGRIPTGPATVDAPRYEVRVSNGRVEVRCASSAREK
jgi:hypothetical protein